MILASDANNIHHIHIKSYTMEKIVHIKEDYYVWNV